MRHYLICFFISFSLISLSACDDGKNKASSDKQKSVTVAQSEIEQPKKQEEVESAQKTAAGSVAPVPEIKPEVKPEGQKSNSLSVKSQSVLFSSKNRTLSVANGKASLQIPENFVEQPENSENMKSYVNKEKEQTFVIIITPSIADKRDVLSSQLKVAEEEMKKRGAKLKRIKQGTTKAGDIEMEQLTLLMTLGEHHSRRVHTFVGVVGDQQINLSFVAPESEEENQQQVINKLLSSIKLKQ